MTPTAREIVSSIRGVVRLALFDPRGLEALDRTPEGARRSFGAAVVVAPFYIALVALRDGDNLADVPFGIDLLVQFIAYVVGWTAFPVISRELARVMGRLDDWPAMVCAYNWSAVVQVALQVPVMALAVSGAADDRDVAGAGLVALIAVAAYLWFIFRSSLRIPGMTALGLVVVELTVTALIADHSAHILELARDAVG